MRKVKLHYSLRFKIIFGLIGLLTLTMTILFTIQYLYHRKKMISKLMKERFPERIQSVLAEFGRVGDELGYSVYAVGGFVRDLLMRVENFDMDIVVEGDGIRLAEEFEKKFAKYVQVKHAIRCCEGLPPDQDRQDCQPGQGRGKRRGFIFQSSDIYGGLSNTWDYGPYGVELKNNVKRAWWKANVYDRNDVYGMDAAILMHPKFGKPRGTLRNFFDLKSDCKSCKKRFKTEDLKGVKIRVPEIMPWVKRSSPSSSNIT
jgi:hypothetical protein